MSKPLLNCIVVGFGYAGKNFHSYLVRHVSNPLTLYGVVSRREELREQARKDLGIKTWDSLENALSDDNVSIVIIATPNESHASLAIDSLRAKKHVVVDKPMALSVSDAQKMIECAKENNRILTVFQNRRWDCDFLTINELLRTKSLGDIHCIELSWCKSLPSTKPWKKYPTVDGGGRFWDLGSHLIDQLLLLTTPEKVTSVHATMAYNDPTMPHTDTHAMVTLTFTHGLKAMVYTSSTAQHDKPRWIISGRDGTYVKYGGDPQEEAMAKGNVEVYDDDVPGVVKRQNGVTEEVKSLRGLWLDFYKNVAEAIEGKAPLAVTPESVVRVLSIIESALLSAQLQQVIKVLI